MKGRRIRALVLVLIVAVALLLVAVAIALFVRNIVGDNAVEPGRYVTIPADYDPAADEWPGASLGFVGPEGQGSLSEMEFETNGSREPSWSQVRGRR